MESPNVWRKSSYSNGEGGNCVEVAWCKSTYSNGTGGNCVEVGWHKSSHSNGDGGNCVEVAEGAETLVRDTQHRSAGHLTMPSAEWTALLDTVRS